MFDKLPSQLQGGLRKRLPVFLCIAVLSAALLSAQPTESPASTKSPAAPTESVLPDRSEWCDSKEALAQAVLDRLAANDAKGLLALTVTQDDYKTIVWPDLPVSNPRNNIPFDWVYGRHTQMSRTSLAFKLTAIKDRKLTYLRMEERPEKDSYPNIHIVPVPFVYVKNEKGEEEQLRLFGSILEHKGKFKVFSYKTD